MKKSLTLLAFISGFACFAQVPDKLNIAIKDGDSINRWSLSVKPDFSFYSKNYDKVFDFYQYSFDAQKTSPNAVYVSTDNKFYFGQNSGFIMDMPQQGLNTNRINCGYAYDLGGLVRGLRNIFEMEKDYSVKQKNYAPSAPEGGQ